MAIIVIIIGIIIITTSIINFVNYEITLSCEVQ